MNNKDNIYLGIDAGSRTIKCVLLSGSGTVIESGVVDQGVKQAELAESLVRDLMGRVSIDRMNIAMTVATGYGRDHIEFANTTFSEITCHARGAKYIVPDARTIIDIGGQDSKLIKLDDKGRVHDFAMNDRCAAGTGRFLEVVADRLEVPLTELNGLARASTSPCIISSTCVVFAETEIIGLLAQEVLPADIAAGIFSAIASRVQAMAGRRIGEPVVMTGGAALFGGLRHALEQDLGVEIKVVDNPRLAGALGAALIAKDKAEEKKTKLT